MLLLTTFPMFHFTHRHDEYAGLIERYRADVDALGDSPLRGAFLAQRGHRLWTAARYDEAIDVLTEGARISSAAGDHASAAHSETMLSWSYSNHGDCVAAERHGLAALEHVRCQPVPMMACYAHVALVLAHCLRGQWKAATEHAAAAREVGVAAADDGLASFGGTFLSWAVTASGNPAGGMEIAQRALDEAPTDYFRGWAAAYLAWAMCRSGDAAAALPILEQAVAFTRNSCHVAGSLFISPLLIEARLGTGDVPGALEFAVNLGAEANAAGMPIVVAAAEMFLGEIDLLGQANDAALEHFRRAAGENLEIGAEDAWCQARFGEGRALAASGDRTGAIRALDDALGGFERLGTGLFPDQVRAALASIA
jgi:tetratricopeptide (TPR) repeat protein